MATGKMPRAELVHDEFHVSKLLGEAVDKVRRAEAKKLATEADDSLKNTCFWWLYGQATLPEKHAVNFERLGPEQPADLPSLVEQGKLRCILASAGSRPRSIFFRSVVCQCLPQQTQPGQTRRPHGSKNTCSGLLAYFVHPVTNAVAELNSKIEAIKHATRDFRSFAS